MDEMTGGVPQVPLEHKRALRRQYKESRVPMGVFAIRNLADGRIYVGASTHLEAAMKRHRFELVLGSHRHAALLRDWRTHGPEQFRFETVDILVPRDEPGFDGEGELAALLELWREELGAYGEHGYNRRGRGPL